MKHPKPPRILQPDNARFWHFWRGSWCKLTLRPGQSFTLREGGPTDEGWTMHAERLTFPEGALWVESLTVNDGRDCDGRMRSVHESFALLPDLRADPCEFSTLAPGVPVPRPSSRPHPPGALPYSSPPQTRAI